MGCPLAVEELESRTLLTAYAPAQILHAYGFDRLPYDGSGQTIAIVEAFDNPSLTYDLQNFDQLFGLPDPVVTIAQPQGQPAYDAGWGLESDLDVEWAHAIAPAANILLVEARNDSGNNLLAAVNYARQQPGVVVVSMSWEMGEFPTERLYDSYFTTPRGHVGGSGLPGGVTFVAASGDSGAGVVWPASSPNVLSIGGTTLILDDNNQIASETGWSGSGGGISSYEAQPDYQVPFQTSGMRTTPDFAYNADLATPYWTYASNYGGLQAVYGTSAGAPQWAALIALVDQALALNGIGSLDGPTQTLPELYSLASLSYSRYYNDIVDGNNGYQAGPGYDLVTGIGTPVADQIVQALVNSAQPPGGGARALKGVALSRRGRLEGLSLPLLPASSHGLARMPAFLPGPRGMRAPNPLPEQGDSVNQTPALLATALTDSAVRSASLTVGDLSLSSQVAGTGSNGHVAVFLLEPAATLRSNLPDGRLEGGANAVLASEAVDDDLAGTITAPVFDPTSSWE